MIHNWSGNALSHTHKPEATLLFLTRRACLSEGDVHLSLSDLFTLAHRQQALYLGPTSTPVARILQTHTGGKFPAKNSTLAVHSERIPAFFFCFVLFFHNISLVKWKTTLLVCGAVLRIPACPQDSNKFSHTADPACKLWALLDFLNADRTGNVGGGIHERTGRTDRKRR